MGTNCCRGCQYAASGNDACKTCEASSNFIPMTLDAESSKRAVELLTAVKQLLEQQKTSDFAVNLLTETVFYGDGLCDGYYIMDNINSFLNECGF